MWMALAWPTPILLTAALTLDNNISSQSFSFNNTLSTTPFVLGFVFLSEMKFSNADTPTLDSQATRRNLHLVHMKREALSDFSPKISFVSNKKNIREERC
jgi:hypothetical protein